MPRPRKQPKDSNLLKDAIDFVSLVQRDDKSHCVMKDGWCAGTDGVMTIACRIEDKIEACPQTRRLAAALKQCGSTLSLALPDPGRLTVVSGPLRATVPCLPDASHAILWADPNIATLNEFFIEGLKAIGHIASESGDKVHLHSILIKDQTMLATNNVVLVEYWHGNSLPPFFVLPKPAVSVLLKINKKLTGFGFSGSSATFHFEDESWLKTLLYEDKWPNVERVLESEEFDYQEFKKVPENLFKAIKSIAELTVGDEVTFASKKLITGKGTDKETSFEVDDLEEGPTFKIANLIEISGLAEKFGFIPLPTGLSFFGNRVRGAIAKCFSPNQNSPQ